MSPPAPSAPRVHDASALPIGTRLGEFELLSLLGIGGFGIVYLAFDHALEREVAVKEYMPASLAGRTETLHVSLRSQSDAETFALGLRSFVNEARLLARFDHPSLLKVLRFWEANGTAYMAMPVMRGRTLKEQRLEMGRAPDENTLRSMLDALLGALERLHGEGVYHRDIAPDNIQIEPDGHPVLLDFGAARRVLSDKTQTLTAILKPAYAPIEQYAETGSVKQGPWTDFYALGATLHYVLLGKPPAPATARAVFDESSALAGQGLPGYSAAFLQMVDWMLAPRPADRPQNVAELRQVLQGERQVPAPFLVEPDSDMWDKTQVLPRGLTGGDDATLVIPRTQAPAGGGAVSQVPGSGGMAAPVPTVALAPTPPATAHQGAADAARSAPGAPVAAGAERPAIQVTAPAPPASVPTPAPTPAPSPTSPPAAARKSLWPLGAAAALALVVAGFVFWPKAGPVPAALPVAAEPAGAAAPPPAAAATPATSPAAAFTAASAAAAQGGSAPPVASAVVPARAVPESEIRPATATTAATAASTRPPARTVGAAAGATKQATAPATAAVQSPAAGDKPAAAGGGAPAPTSETATAPQQPGAVVTATQPPSVQTPVDSPAAPPATGATGPEAKCGGRNPLLYFVCMERECLRSSQMGHADCLAWRKAARRD